MQNYERRMLRVLQYIHDNPAGDLSLDRLADEAAMSRFHWHRVFRAMTGETCAQAVRRVRLYRAGNMLVREARTPDEIAATVGYDNGRSFARAFSAYYGMSPLAFRKQRRNPPPLWQCKEGEKHMFDVTVRETAPLTLVGVAHTGSYYKIGAAFDQLWAICSSRNLWPQLGRPAGIYYDNPEIVAEADLRGFAGIEARDGAVPEGLEQRDIAGGRMAVLTHRGPYSGTSAAYDVLFGQWLPQSGELPADAPCFEVYLNSPLDVAEEDLLTEIYLPLRDTLAA